VTALVVLKSIEGFESITEMMIKNWMPVGTVINRGRPRCEEFEEEVMAECERAVDPKRKRLSSANDFSYELVRKSANLLMDKEYCDKESGSYVKKWRVNKTTRRLCFTNKWILGVLRRHSTRCTLASHVDRIIPSPSSAIDNRLLGESILSVFDEAEGGYDDNVQGNFDLIDDVFPCM